MQKLIVSLAVIVACSSVARSALCDDTAPSDSPPETYRLQMFGADLLSVGLVIGGAAADSEVMMYGGLAVGAFGAPLVHFANGHSTRGLWSMGVRIAAPLAGAVLGVALGEGCDSSESDTCALNNLGNAFLGWTIGYTAGLVTDYVFIASLDDKPATVAKSPGIGMALLPRAGGMLLSAGGAF